MRAKLKSPPCVAAFGALLAAGLYASPAVAMPVGARLANPQLPHAAPFLHRLRGAQSVDWPQLGFDSGHSAYNPYETTIGPNNVGSLRQAWSFSTGSGNNAGNIVEAGGVVYAPSANGMLYALDASSGTQLWSFASGSGHSTSGSAPVYDGGLVFTVCNTSASTQGICALNARNATPVWSYTFPGSTAYDGTPPVVADGGVLFEACALSCSYVALAEQNGSVLWVVNEPQGSCEGNGGVTPSVSYKLMYVEETCSGSLGHVVALRAKNGTTKWTNVDEVGANAGTSVGGGVVANVFQTPSSGQLLRDWNAKKGTFRWEDQGGGWPGTALTMPAITKDFVYVTAPGYGAVLIFDRGGGKYEGGTAGNGVTSWPSVANEVLYVGCGDALCAYDANGSTLLWSTTGSASHGVPIIADGVVYAACNGSNVCAWALPSELRRRH
jgi:eukaryotic-like serine/threonine-protein kinase